MKRRTLGVITTSSYLFLQAKTTAHSEGVSLGVYPPLTRIRTKYKAHVISPVTILNNSDQTINLNVEYKAFTANPDGSIKYYTEKSTPLYISNFLATIKTFDGENEAKVITAFPKQYKPISIQFDSPPEEKDFYFTVFFTPVNINKTIDNSSIFIIPSIGTNYLITVNKKNTFGMINQFKMNSVIMNDSTQLSLNVKNSSDNFVTATGNISIYDFLGKKVSQIELYPTTILSNSSQNLYAKVKNQKEALVWNHKLALGYYTAEASVKFDDSFLLIEKTHSFGAPILLLIILTLLFFTVLSVLYKVIKKLNFKE